MMLFKNFRIQVIIRTILLFLTLLALAYLILQTFLYATIGILILLALYQIYGLIRMMDQSNTRMAQFLQAVRHADFSQSFKRPKQGKSFDQLNDAFTQVIQDFQKIRGDKEENYRYLHTVVQHVGVGLIAFDHEGNIEIFNTASKKLLGISQLRNISGLETISTDLSQKISILKSGGRDLIKIQRDDNLLHLSAYATEFQLRDRSLKLISLQNIQSELEEQEMEAWQKLIRVLTHEIMNSITPISSLAKTVDQTLNELKFDDLDEADMQDIHDAVGTIHKRSEGLIHFVESYRKLTRIPQPNFQMISVDKMFNTVLNLTEVESRNKNIRISASVKPISLHVIADQELIEQVLINLIRNAFDALSNTEEGRLALISDLDQRGRVMIRVVDNGSGIEKEAQEKIFIPFFTTKKSGSGIGLSLSRQIMRQHGGSLGVTSEPDVETVFKLSFS